MPLKTLFLDLFVCLYFIDGKCIGLDKFYRLSCAFFVMSTVFAVSGMW